MDYNGEIKQKPLSRFRHIHKYFGIFRHIQTCLEIIQAYSEPYVTQAYTESWYIQNQKWRHIQTPVKHLQWNMLQNLLTTVVVFANYFPNYFSKFTQFHFFTFSTYSNKTFRYTYAMLKFYFQNSFKRFI